MKLTIGHLYPDLLNLYGDRGKYSMYDEATPMERHRSRDN